MSEYSYLKRVEVSVNELKVGMYVGKLDKPWADSSFLFQGFPIESEEQISKLKHECRKVYVDFKTQQDYDVYLLNAGSEVDVVQKEDDTKLVEELPLASKALKNAFDRIKLETAKVKLGHIPDIQSYQALVAGFAGSIHRNPDALMLLQNIRRKAFYELEHPIRVALMAMAFGKHINVSDTQLHLLGLSGLLYDIGKLTLPQEIINKAGKVSKEEAIALKEHPKTGFRILNQIKGLSEVVKEVALSHHERADGKGYPRSIHKDRVSRYAKIISIIDAYDAMTSERPYSDARSSSHAMKMLVKNVETKFDKDLVEAFGKWNGTTPIGCLVEMKTGEVGFILKNRIDHPIKPRIMLVTDELKKSGYTKIIDLMHSPVHSSGQLYKIHSMLENQAFGIEIAQYLDKMYFEVADWTKSSKSDKNSPFSKFL